MCNLDIFSLHAGVLSYFIPSVHKSIKFQYLSIPFSLIVSFVDRKIFERIKESKWGTSCKSSISKILETQVIFPIAIVNYPELYFLLKVQITKTNITLDRERELYELDAFGKEYHI